MLPEPIAVSIDNTYWAEGGNKFINEFGRIRLCWRLRFIDRGYSSVTFITSGAITEQHLMFSNAVDAVDFKLRYL